MFVGFSLFAIHEIRFGLRFHPMKTFSLFVPHSFYFSFLILSLSQSVSQSVSISLSLSRSVSFEHHFIRLLYCAMLILVLPSRIIPCKCRDFVWIRITNNFIMDFVYVCNKILLDQMNSYSYIEKKKNNTHNTQTLLIWAQKSNMTEVPF